MLVTGGSSGIGAATAIALAERGATVGIVGRREEKLRAVLDRCRAHAPDSRMWVQDLGDLDAATALVGEAWSAFDGLDVLVNNAAMPMRRPVTRITPEEVATTMRVNFESPVRMTLAALPRMLDRGSGCIVNVSSFGGRVPVFDETAYCASKAALCGWTEAMALDLHDAPVAVRLILPGAIDTDIWDRPGSDPPIYDGPLEAPETVADGIIAAIEGATTEHYLPDMRAIAEFKTSDLDGFITGAAAFADRATDPAADRSTATEESSRGTT